MPKLASCKCVVIQHGYFSSNRIGPQRLYFQTAEMLSSMGYNVLRMDLEAQGESDGDISTIVFQDHLNQFLELVDYMVMRFDSNTIDIIAHCSGCRLALDAKSIRSEQVGALILLAPSFFNNAVLWKVFKNEGLIKQLIENGSTTRKGLFAHISFFAPFENKQFHGISCDNIHILVPSADELVDNELTISIATELKMQIHFIPNGDHNFLEVPVREALLNTIKTIMEI